MFIKELGKIDLSFALIFLPPLPYPKKATCSSSFPFSPPLPILINSESEPEDFEGDVMF